MSNIISTQYFEEIKKEKEKTKEINVLAMEIAKHLSLCPLETKINFINKNTWEYLIGDKNKLPHGRFVLQNDKSCYWTFWGYNNKVISNTHEDASIGIVECITCYNNLKYINICS